VFCADVDPEDAAVIVVGAFDGLKNMSDTLNGGGTGFKRRAEVLMLAIEASLRV
jgi:hypothetical protein